MAYFVIVEEGVGGLRNRRDAVVRVRVRTSDYGANIAEVANAV